MKNLYKVILCLFFLNNVYSMQKSNYQQLLEAVENLDKNFSVYIFRNILDILNNLKYEKEILEAHSLIQGILHKHTDKSQEIQIADKELAEYYKKKISQENLEITKLNEEISEEEEDLEEFQIPENDILYFNEEKKNLEEDKAILSKKLEEVSKENQRLRYILSNKAQDLELINNISQEDPEELNKSLLIKRQKLLELIKN